MFVAALFVLLCVLGKVAEAGEGLRKSDVSKVAAEASKVSLESGLG